MAQKMLIFEFLAICLKRSDPQVERSLNEVLLEQSAHLLSSCCFSDIMGNLGGEGI